MEKGAGGGEGETVGGDEGGVRQKGAEGREWRVEDARVKLVSGAKAGCRPVFRT